MIYSFYVPKQVSVSVREARPGDEPLIVGLIQELARTVGESSLITPEYAREYLSFPGNGVLLAEEEGQALGLLS